MISKLKKQLIELIQSLGYNISDNGAYEESFPWLMLRTSGHNRQDSWDIRYDIISLTIDIFSSYTGEKEILDIIENISNNINTMRKENESIMAISQMSCRVVDDNSKGPVKKHGVITYRFLLSSLISEMEGEENE